MAPDRPQLLAPIGYAFVDSGSIITLRWLFSDGDPLEHQTKAGIRYRGPDDVDWTTVASASTDDTAHYDVAADALAAYIGQAVEWQATTYDSAVVVGPWSDSEHFQPVVVPADPTIVSPTTSITSNTQPVHFTTPDGLVAYEIQLRDAAGAAVLADLSVNPVGLPTSVTANLPSYAYVNATDYQIWVRWQKNVGVWSDWVNTGAIPAAVESSSVPTLTLSADASLATITVAIVNPGSDPNPPDHNDVYRTDSLTGVESRIATGVAVNGSYVDHVAGFNRSYRYRVVAVTAAGAYTSSG